MQSEIYLVNQNKFHFAFLRYVGDLFYDLSIICKYVLNMDCFHR
jgi:hypothetical protein